MSKTKINNYYNSNEKRLLDVLLCVFLILLILPFAITLLPLFLVKIGRPIIFKQKRMGKNKKPFTMYKIRTMKLGSDRQQNKLKKLSVAPWPMFKIKNDPRFIGGTGGIGEKLSKFGIDELPQVINILKGEMSFVGPRPLPMSEAKKLSTTWDFRYKVKPGILSKWALSQRRYESLNEWSKLEKETLYSGSIVKDLKLVWEAFWQVVVGNLKK